MRPAVVLLVAASLVLAGCGGVLWRRPVAVDAARASAGAAERPPAAAPAPSAPEPPKLAAELTRLAGELAELQNAVAKLMASARQQEDQLLFLQRRVGELEAQNRSRAPSVPSGFAPPAPAPPALAPPPPTAPPLGSAATTPAEDLYRVGVEKLRAKDLDAAVLILYDLVSTHPDHPLRESAQFLVGDILYQQKDYRGALAEFEALLGAVPGGDKTPDALLKIGLCQRSLGDRARARRTWEHLVREYPGSVAARQARVLLRG